MCYIQAPGIKDVFGDLFIKNLHGIRPEGNNGGKIFRSQVSKMILRGKLDADPQGFKRPQALCKVSFFHLQN